MRRCLSRTGTDLLAAGGTASETSLRAISASRRLDGGDFMLASASIALMRTISSGSRESWISQMTGSTSVRSFSRGSPTPAARAWG